MNLLNKLEQGKKGKNMGLPTGIPPLDRMINGVHRKAIIGIAAAPKVGKSTLANFAFVLSPLLYAIENNIQFKIIYFSYEIDRISCEFDFVCYFLYHDYNIHQVEINGIMYDINSNLLQGKVKDKDHNLVVIPKELEDRVIEIYNNRIKVMFGEYDEKGKRIKEGYIDFQDKRDNPTGIRNHILDHAKKYGDFIYEEYKDKQGNLKEKLSGYKYKKKYEDLFVLVLMDHLRKCKHERGFNKKQNVDKLIEYQVEIRNLCEFSFVDIIHLNRNISNIDRLKYLGDKIFPTGDDIKDTGNLSEEANYLITMFNPADEKYGLTSHFGKRLSSYPNYRSIHLVESRDTPCPDHVAVSMYGGIKTFKSLGNKL